MRDTEREAGSMQGPDVGLDPGTPGLHSEPKAEVQLLSHPGVPNSIPFYGYTTVHLPIHLLMNIWVVFGLGLLQMKRL